MKIFVKNVMGKIITIDNVNKNTDIETIKDEIKIITGIPVRLQKLMTQKTLYRSNEICDGFSVLNNTDELEDFDIENGSTLYLVQKIQ